MYLIQDRKTAYRIIDGEAVIVDPGTSMLYSLNPVATLIWEMSSERTAVEEIVDRIVEEFDVERSTAEEDCLELVRDFVDRGILIAEED